MGYCCLEWLVLPDALCTTQEPEVAKGCHASFAKLGAWRLARGGEGGEANGQGFGVGVRGYERWGPRGGGCKGTGGVGHPGVGQHKQTLSLKLCSYSLPSGLSELVQRCCWAAQLSEDLHDKESFIPS